MNMKLRFKYAVLLIIFCVLWIYWQFSSPKETTSKKQMATAFVRKDPESYRGTWLLGKLFCSPGYTGELCDTMQIPANPWYTAHCPNLDQTVTYRVDMPLSMISNGTGCLDDKKKFGFSKCAYLCFSHEKYGVTQIPYDFWKLFQNNEANAWVAAGGNNDRGAEHKEGFNNYEKLPKNLGNYIEIGCGPFTQTQFIIEKTFESITLLDPGANGYIQNVETCTYRNGYLFNKKVNILSFGAEKLSGGEFESKFDTLLSINVIEHVWDAYAYLSNIYHILKPGGIVIFHERYFPNPNYGDKVLGTGDWYHPIRITKMVLEHFLDFFDPIYVFDGQTTEQIKRQYGELGFYFIGAKKGK